jgi:very-short-patch-repair endonuclease
MANSARIAGKLRRNQTDAERLLWFKLRDRRLAGFKFRRQFPVGKYIVDFVCLDARVVIEIDGGQHSENLLDTERQAFIEEQGFVVLRFWNTK